MTDQRKANRVVFEKGFASNMMAIDGTWRRPCTMLDVSDTGARLSIEGSIQGLALTEFFLVFSTVGKAYRRCELAWVNGNEVGVHFIKPVGTKKSQNSTRSARED
jgi:PilZ domain